MRARKVNRLGHIARGRAPCDQRRMTVECAIPEPAGIVVPVLPSEQHTARKARAELADFGGRECDRFAIGPDRGQIMIGYNLGENLAQWNKVRRSDRKRGRTEGSTFHGKLPAARSRAGIYKLMLV